ncbi:hypothetical protein QQX98_012099 [Neonectria punicea]|uniref:Cytochrome P450 n=1 Tax=Neonectria punicea TaxID=979145 RepID=A0ABR1GK61_9HYPO
MWDDICIAPASCFVLVVVAALTAQWLKYHVQLGQIPGPALARLTNLWRYWDVRNGAHHMTLIALHRKYGDVVRVGPNAVSISDPGAIPKIYGITKGFCKGEFYQAFVQHDGGKVIPALFTEADESIHRAIRRPVSLAYSMRALLKYEPAIDAILTATWMQMHQSAIFHGWGT